MKKNEEEEEEDDDEKRNKKEERKQKRGIEPREIKHEQNGHRIIADQRQHVDKLLLATEIPDAEGDFWKENSFKKKNENELKMKFKMN